MNRERPTHINLPGIGVDPFAGYAIAWATLDEAETADALTELEDWIQWLTSRYGLDHRHVPACWAGHGELIEELSALHTAWQRAYAPDAPGDAPLRWHEAFDASRERLQSWVARTGCRGPAHVARTAAAARRRQGSA
jgi:hypothetical protein